MLTLRNFSFLTKNTLNHAETVNTTILGRNLRNLSRQKDNPQSTISQTEQQDEKPGECNTPGDYTKLESIMKEEHATTSALLPTTENQQGEELPALPKADKDYVPTFNFAAYVNKSPTLQQLVKLGVDLHSIERRKGLPQFVLRLDFEKDIKPYLLFLQDQGVPAEQYGAMITKNPLVFKVDMDDLVTRVNYLEAKRFTPSQVQRILTLNPYWLMLSTRRIDRRLGYFQKTFHLSGNDVRFLASKQPRLITFNINHIQKATFCIREEMGFDDDEMKCLLLSKPRLWMLESDELIERFAYAHKDMQLSHDMLLQFPEVLTSREHRLRQRHEFLKMLGRAQYDPEKDLYISPKDVVSDTNLNFVQNVAKSDMETFELFMKTR